MSPLPDNYSAHRKAVWVVVVAIVTASVSGYFMGLRQTSSVIRSAEVPEREFAAHPEAWPISDGVPRVAEYSKLAKVNYKANSQWSNTLEKLVRPKVDLFAPVTIPPEQAAASLRERATRRAFDGAPPVVPHPIDPISPASCLACHGEATPIKDRVAPKMSHSFMQNCTQCHVPAGGPGLNTPPGWVDRLASNEFAGVTSSGKGQRAYPGAPPTIPHPTSMRHDCSSCHGPLGSAALRTSHPWRQSCTQCHAPSAETDQRLFSEGLFPKVEQSSALQ